MDQLVSTGPQPRHWIFQSKISNRTHKLGAQFVEVPGEATKVKSYASWRKDLANWIYRNQRLELLESPTLDIVSNPGESERDFRVRLQQIGREQRDDAVEKLRRKYAPKVRATGRTKASC